MAYFLKTERGKPATEIAMESGQSILDRGRHQGRRVVEVYVLHQDGHIDRYEEHARRRLGSNAISSRTWLCQTFDPNGPAPWASDRYIPNPEQEIKEIVPAPNGVVLVLLGAEGDSGQVVQQLETRDVEP
ncbi:MAG TPA: hypothetical protein VFI42_21360 [Thermomicrobiaceae bacterium]|nr:hypothetical protein [Thermomicrobiaceae bacterium]